MEPLYSYNVEKNDERFSDILKGQRATPNTQSLMRQQSMRHLPTSSTDSEATSHTELGLYENQQKKMMNASDSIAEGMSSHSTQLGYFRQQSTRHFPLHAPDSATVDAENLHPQVPTLGLFKELSVNSALTAPSTQDFNELFSQHVNSRSEWYPSVMHREAQLDRAIRKKEQKDRLRRLSAIQSTSGADVDEDGSSASYAVNSQQNFDTNTLDQVETLKEEIQVLRDESIRYHENLETLDKMQARNEELEEEIELLARKYKRMKSKKKAYENILQSLRLQMATKFYEQEQQGELFEEKVKTLKSIIIQDQRYFAQGEMENEETIKSLEIEKNKTTDLEATLENLKDQYFHYERQIANGSSHIVIKNKNERKDVAKMEREIATLKMELAQVRSREDWHMLHIKKYEEYKSASGAQTATTQTVEKNVSNQRMNGVTALRKMLTDAPPFLNRNRNDTTSDGVKGKESMITENEVESSESSSKSQSSDQRIHGFRKILSDTPPFLTRNRFDSATDINSDVKMQGSSRAENENGSSILSQSTELRMNGLRKMTHPFLNRNKNDPTMEEKKNAQAKLLSEENEGETTLSTKMQPAEIMKLRFPAFQRIAKKR